MLALMRSPSYSPLPSPIPAVASRTVRRPLIPFVCLAAFCVVAWHSYPTISDITVPQNVDTTTAFSTNECLIIVVTPTYARPTRMPDLTRLAQTLMLVKNIHWLVIEDANRTSDAVNRLLQRSGVPHTYLFTTSVDSLPKRGWSHRNMAIDIIKTKYRDYNGCAVVYFADDDNTYDFRLFDEYIRKVKGVGLWAVGFSGGAKVEAPHVENGKITKWDVVYAPKRQFATDMAGFAVNLRVLINSTARFTKKCGKSDPENCFLKQLNVSMKDLEPFGYDRQPKEILVWHTQSKLPKGSGPSYGYVYEEKKT
ncbi:unnamed protein product [Bursaphelenchus xylophilus]|uniref:Galactosylgalactosylxylosylprotein 3-beta-glucuronosyltransferase n=1 Tax=Bursaphelenchus xylophilus TaxID=6326 RepID=A0A1I7RYX6_BURXY|nr:unnamed protein product [Bursaphelenchus xylophilus]CAG9092066.1 unnamed protein product [Bursaphelenchus xylophilus]